VHKLDDTEQRKENPGQRRQKMRKKSPGA